MSIYEESRIVECVCCGQKGVLKIKQSGLELLLVSTESGNFTSSLDPKLGVLKEIVCLDCGEDQMKRVSAPEDKPLAPGTRVFLSSGEYGIVSHTYKNVYGDYNCYVTFFGRETPEKGCSLNEKPYVLHYFQASLEPLDENWRRIRATN